MSYYSVLIFLILFFNEAILSNSKQLSKWDAYKKKFSKRYRASDEEKKQKTFENNLQLIENHNKDFEQGKVTWKMSISQFADLTKEEFKTQSRCHIGNSTFDRKTYPSKYDPKNTLPERVDWRDKNVVGPIKDQGDCGSCWAFSAIGAIESQVLIQYKNVLGAFSEQALVDCSHWDQRCHGGFKEYGFAYAAQEGLPTEREYPYKGYVQDCDWPDETVFNIGTYAYVHSDDKSLAWAVSDIGPISVTIDASNMQHYGSGIFQDIECSKSDPTYEAIVVGYSEENGTKFWIVRNSWGHNWGEGGYIKISREIENMCGILDNPSYPILIPQFVRK